MPREMPIIKTSPAVSPHSSRHALDEEKMHFPAATEPNLQKFSSSIYGSDWFAHTQNTSTCLSQLTPNQQKERKSKEQAAGHARVECHLCGKLLLNKKGLKCHIHRVHSKPNITSTNSESSLNSSQNLPTSDLQENNNDPSMRSSMSDMEAPNSSQERGVNSKCAIMFVIGGKKLKLTTLVINASLCSPRNRILKSC